MIVHYKFVSGPPPDEELQSALDETAMDLVSAKPKTNREVYEIVRQTLRARVPDGWTVFGFVWDGNLEINDRRKVRRAELEILGQGFDEFLIPVRVYESVGPSGTSDKTAVNLNARPVETAAALPRRADRPTSVPGSVGLYVGVYGRLARILLGRRLDCGRIEEMIDHLGRDLAELTPVRRIPRACEETVDLIVQWWVALGE